MTLLIIFSFLAGIATVLSPCILPVLPAILSASASGGKGRPMGVILGLMMSFVFFTLALTTLVQSLGLSANILRYIAIGIIGFFGVVLFIPSLSEKFAMLTQSIGNFGSGLQTKGGGKPGFVSGLVIGAALGLVWTPCAGPILAAITTLVATQKVSFSVFLLTLAYSLGAAFPLFFIAYGGQKAFSLPSLAKYSEKIRQFFGVLMMLTALALAFNWDIAFQQSILDYIPRVQLENNERLKREIEKLRGPSPFEGKEKLSHKPGELPHIATAPPIVGITAWINSPPLTLENLKGKVVLIDFWTYSCINCIRTFPYLRKWYESYQDKGFVIVGVHTPEFEFEKDENNVRKAVDRFKIKYPVAMDNNYATWQSYHNSYWPAHYLIDQNGIVREIHFGEGGYLETENGIRSLLNLPPLVKEEETAAPLRVSMTPETYLGYKRAAAYTSENKIIPGRSEIYHYYGMLGSDQVGIKGEWTVEEEYIRSNSGQSTLSLNFEANRVYLVLSGTSSDPITVDLDGKPLPIEFRTAEMDSQGKIFVKDARKYDIVDLKGKGGRHTVTLHIPTGIKAYAFTFGMEEGETK